MIRRMVARDEGFALAAVLGIAALITVVAVGGFWTAQQTVHESVLNRAETRSFQVANSGLDLELATFDPSNIDAGRYPFVGYTTDGQYTLNVQQLTEYEYLLTSTGYSEGASETVVQRFFYLNLWDMNMGAGEGAALGGGSAWNGQATIDGPLYIRGDMEWGASSNYYGGPLFVRDGVIDTTNGGSGCFLGTPAEPVKVYCTGGTVNLQKISSYLDGPIRTSVPDIELPWVDEDYLDAAFDRARIESVDNIMGGTTSSTENSESVGVDPSTYVTLIPGRLMASTTPGNSSECYKCMSDDTHDDLGNGAKSLTIGPTSFGAWEGNGYGASSGLHDDFAFDAAAGTLYLEGTVYIDGPVEFTSNVSNYVGNGTLVANGDILIEGNLVPRDGVSVGQVLGLVTPGDVWLHKEALTGCVFCNGTLTLDMPGTRYEGTALAGVISATGPNITLVTNPIISEVLPESMPGAGGGLVFPGTWSRR